VQAATKVKLNKTKVTMPVGGTVKLKVSGTSKKVTWKSSNEKIATVSSKGKVTAKKKGTAKITATVNGEKYTCKVTVEKPSISEKTATVVVGETISLSVEGTTQKVTWSSDDKSVAKVSKKGVVTGVSEGTVNITATVNGGKYTCKVTVEPSIVAESSSITVKTGSQDIVVLTMAQRTDVSRELSYSVEDTNIATCELDGEDDIGGLALSTRLYIYGQKAGSTTITIYNLKTNEEIVIYVVVKDDFSVSRDVSENIATLKGYIKTYGSTNADGNKFIKSELDGYSGTIIYKESDYALSFIFESDDGSTTGNMTIGTATNKILLTYALYLSRPTYSYSIYTTLDPTTYNPNKTYYFAFIESTPWLTTDSVQGLGNVGMALAFSYWQQTLKENLSMGLSDIGFTAYK
jgi:hypothetical protein